MGAQAGGRYGVVSRSGVMQRWLVQCNRCTKLPQKRLLLFAADGALLRIKHKLVTVINTPFPFGCVLLTLATST